MINFTKFRPKIEIFNNKLFKKINNLFKNQSRKNKAHQALKVKRIIQAIKLQILKSFKTSKKNLLLKKECLIVLCHQKKAVMEISASKILI